MPIPLQKQSPQGDLQAKVRNLVKFSQPNLAIKHPKAVETKLKSIISDGKDKLYIITDFNMTLTKFWTNNKQNCDTFNVLEKAGAVSSRLIQAQAQLRKDYYRIESDPEMGYLEKESLLTDIIKQNNELYIDEKFTKHQLAEVLKGYPIVYRDGARDLVTLTALHQIPVLVFSAGLGDVVVELMKSQDMLLPHMHVVSNFMEFDPISHQITGFTPPLIHTLNKGTVKLESTPFYAQARGRTNVIVMGDSIGDLEMGSALQHHTRLTVGLLNQNTEANLAEYMDKFDIVLTNDSSLDWLNNLLSSL